MLATFDGEKITLEEKHRFSNDPVNINGDLHWDVLRSVSYTHLDVYKRQN